MKSNHIRFSLGLISAMLLSGPACNVPKQTNQNKAAASSVYPDPEKFSEHIRSTDFQTPEQEQAGFKLPPGFEITLYASEPNIGKPINIAFDEKGRLWVTQSSEYPVAAPSLNGRDKITILEDTDGDGKADKFLPYAEDLNIPIGILPSGNDALAFSIPNVYKFTDADGDGKADNKKTLLGEFGYNDTHGMVNNFIRGFDGWIYACHGFTNTSTIAGADGDSITMTSGNTFRFRPDGSRVEQTSYGRVNPFGYSFDEWGYLYSVDCHSKPIYQLINGAEYPHFGKKEPALGFAPEMMSYELGSTALSGLVYYTGNQFPKEYQGSFFNGDVVTCRINRNTITFNGSSPEASRQEDFLISADPWFRPVDIKMGPDGALYVADFYNRIIGHYEVPLDHPLRDRQSGRIWRITYTGDKAKPEKKRDWTKASLNDLVKNLNHPQLNLRMMIANQLVEKYPQQAVEPVIKMLRSSKADPASYVQGLWVLARLNALPENITDAALKHADPLIRVHAYRVLGERKLVAAKYLDLARTALSDENAHVRRAAVEVLGRNPHASNIAAILSLYQSAGAQDSHLKYTALLAFRDNLRNAEVMKSVLKQKWDDQQLAILYKVAGDVPSKDAAVFALNYLEKHDVDKQTLEASLEHIARYLDPTQLKNAIALIRKKFVADLDVQYLLYTTIQKGLMQQGNGSAPEVKAWAVDLAKKLLEDVPEEGTYWSNRPLVGTGEPENPWAIINRPILGELPHIKMIWSEQNWYAPTGTLVSPLFKIPEVLEMSVFDNDVHNTESKIGNSKNSVRIRLAKNRQIIAEYKPVFKQVMKNTDLIKDIPFDLEEFEGELGYLEVTDSTKTGSIGVGGFKPAVLSVPDKGMAEMAQRYAQAAEIVGTYKVEALEPVMRKFVSSKNADYKVRAAAAAALLSISPERSRRILEEVFMNLDESQLIKEKFAQVIGQDQSEGKFGLLQRGFSGAERSLQLAIASILVNSSVGIDRLIQSVQQGDVAYDILTDISIRERLANNVNKAQQQQLDQLASGQASESEARKKLIEARLADFNPANVNEENGKAVFIQNCSMCHQIKGNGGLIGPQLDGIGNWGQKALTEKILDPNRNISQAFRTYNITLTNGSALSGLFRREEGEVLVFANPGGQEFTVANSDIRERKASKYTLMPDHFGNTIEKKDFDALLKYLLTVKE
jgi:putative heme-binding domain-containing protein